MNAAQAVSMELPLTELVLGMMKHLRKKGRKSWITAPWCNTMRSLEMWK